MYGKDIHAKNWHTKQKNYQLVEGWTALHDIVLPMPLQAHCSYFLTILKNFVQPESGVTKLNNIVDNYDQWWQHTALFNPVFINLKEVDNFFCGLRDTPGQLLLYASRSDVSRGRLIRKKRLS